MWSAVGASASGEVHWWSRQLRPREARRVSRNLCAGANGPTKLPEINSHRELRFEGIATAGGNPRGPLPATLWVQFDCGDPIAGVAYSPAWPFVVADPSTATPIDVSWTIDFCPQQDSSHFATDTPDGGVVNVAGVFTHRCVPEPGSFALVGALGLVGFVAWRRIGWGGDTLRRLP